MKKQYKLLIFLFLIPFLGFSNNEDLGYTKQKNIKKAYFVNSDAGINIDNSYGNITVSTWDEEKIELDILIKVSGDSEKWVNQRIDDINVDISALKIMITAQTIITNSSFYNNGNNNSFEINYVIKIPKNASVKLTNKYGDIFSADINGNANIDCKYGKIVLGKLNGNKNDIDIKYCPKSTIDFIKNATISANYSGLKINETTKLDLNSHYTDVDINESLSVNYDSSYGSLKFIKVNSLVGSGNYLTLKIGELSGNLKLDTKYSTINIGLLNAKTNSIDISGGYTNVSIGFVANYAFDFDVSGKYINFKHPNDFEMNNSEETNSTKRYNGFYNKKSLNKIRVSSDYGNVNLSKKQ